MKSALVDIITGAVLNMIVADPAIHQAPPGTRLIKLEENQGVDQNWKWTEQQGFIPPRVFVEVDADGVVSDRIVQHSDQPSPISSINKTVIEIKFDDRIGKGWKFNDKTKLFEQLDVPDPRLSQDPIVDGAR